MMQETQVPTPPEAPEAVHAPERVRDAAIRYFSDRGYVTRSQSDSGAEMIKERRPNRFVMALCFLLTLPLLGIGGILYYLRVKGEKPDVIWIEASTEGDGTATVHHRVVGSKRGRSTERLDFTNHL
jgi:hypothetical protein